MAIHVLIESFSVLCPLRGRYLGAEPSAAGKGDCVASNGIRLMRCAKIFQCNLWGFLKWHNPSYYHFGLK